MSKRGNKTIVVGNNGKYQNLLEKYRKTKAKLKEKTLENVWLEQQIEERDLKIVGLETVVMEKDREIGKLRHKLAYFRQSQHPLISQATWQQR